MGRWMAGCTIKRLVFTVVCIVAAFLLLYIGASDSYKDGRKRANDWFEFDQTAGDRTKSHALRDHGKKDVGVVGLHRAASAQAEAGSDGGRSGTMDKKNGGGGREAQKIQPHTGVSYDNTTRITCPSSPYIMCDGMPGPRSAQELAADRARHPPYKVAMIRAAYSAKVMDFTQCPYTNCVSVPNGPDVDVLHIYGVSLDDRFPLPKRYTNQTWLFSVWESPFHTHADFINNPKQSVWNDAFNMTMTYRLDSDVFAPYSRLAFEPIPLEKRPNYYEIARNKTRSVAWFVSNCKTPSKRQQYIRELKKYIDVDVYGGCGKSCGKDRNSCMDYLRTTYKFYLSFENSICTDYVTEKLFKLYEPDLHVIPVTRGAVPYSRYFPPNTFIDAADFASPRLLAEHLKSLGSDLHRYAQMLEHKQQYRWLNRLYIWCYLCEMLNTEGLKPKTVNMRKFWLDGQCKPIKDLV